MSKAETGVGAIIEQYTKGTGDGGQEMKDIKEIPAVAGAIQNLMNQCGIEAMAPFPDVEPEDIRDIVEAEVMRKVLWYDIERSEMLQINAILQLSDAIRGKIGRVFDGESLTTL